MTMKSWAAALATALVSGVAMAQTPAFDPRSWKRDVVGPPTQVMVLGSTHLSGFSDFQPEWMTAVLDKLAVYNPTVVTVEGVSGQQCDLIRHYPTLYPGVADQYCRSTVAAREATGLDVPAAFAQMEATLATWPATPPPAARRRLASVMLAAGEPASALVQWLRLPATERRAGDGLDAAAVKALGRMMAAADESYQVAARLAARLGLDRVYAVDDHTSDAVQSDDPAFEAAIQHIWSGPNPAKAALEAQPHASSADMLAIYRLVNSPGTLRNAITADFGASIKDKTAARWGRQYVGWWEVRNLRMVANIRAAFAPHPGARVLSVVGSSHKPYFDAYLEMMHEVRLVDAAAVLR